MCRELIAAGLTLFLGQFALSQELVGLGRGEPLVEVFDRDTGYVAEPVPKLAGLGRLLALAAAEVHRQADDEAADLFVLGELREILGVKLRGATGVVFVRAGNADLQVGQGDADTDGAVVDAGDLERADALSAEGVSEARAADDNARLSEALFDRGAILRGCGRLREAIPVFEEALTYTRGASPAHPTWTIVLGNLGAAMIEVGESERGRALIVEALEACRALGQALFAGLMLARLAYVDMAAGETVRAATRWPPYARPSHSGAAARSSRRAIRSGRWRRIARRL